MSRSASASPVTTPDEPLSPLWLRKLRKALLAWFNRHARDLPWRETSDPYAIWISEIMLQQTQVATVRGYWRRFLAAFPTVDTLAAAPEEQVLRLWEGLGYYRRARQLHRAAQVMVAEHDSQFPRDRDQALALPGVGRYTVGAVLSIAFDAREPILEANSIRLLARLLTVREDPTAGQAQRRLWDAAEKMLPARRAGAFNQGLMELGSEICTPRSPRCEECPLRRQCGAYAAGLVEEIPAAGKRMKYEDLREAAVVVQRAGKVLLRQCQPGERWAGLWDFPRFEVTSSRGQKLNDQLTAGVLHQTGLTIESQRRLTTIKHSVTRFRITLHCHQATTISGRLKRNADLKWLSLRELEAMPLSVTGRKIARLLAAEKEEP